MKKRNNIAAATQYNTVPSGWRLAVSSYIKRMRRRRERKPLSDENRLARLLVLNGIITD